MKAKKANSSRILESCFKTKNNLIFIFTLLCGASKVFVKAIKGTVMQIEKALINDRLGVSKVS